MTESNLAIVCLLKIVFFNVEQVFAPNILRDQEQSICGFMDTSQLLAAVQSLIQNYTFIFE